MLWNIFFIIKVSLKHSKNGETDGIFYFLLSYWQLHYKSWYFCHSESEKKKQSLWPLPGYIPKLFQFIWITKIICILKQKQMMLLFSEVLYHCFVNNIILIRLTGWEGFVYLYSVWYKYQYCKCVQFSNPRLLTLSFWFHWESGNCIFTSFIYSQAEISSMAYGLPEATSVIHWIASAVLLHIRNETTANSSCFLTDTAGQIYLY